MIAEDMTITQATQILRLVTFEYNVHLEHCPFCQPGTWLCPEAHDFLDSMKHWDKRLVSLLPDAQEGGSTR